MDGKRLTEEKRKQMKKFNLEGPWVDKYDSLDGGITLLKERTLSQSVKDNFIRCSVSNTLHIRSLKKWSPVPKRDFRA